MAFDLSQQVTLHIGADSGDIRGDTGGDSRTIRTDCSIATLGTTKDYLNPHINYLLVPTVNSSQDLALDGSHSGSQAADQLISQVPHQHNHQPDHHSTSQPTLQAQPPSNPLQQLNSSPAPSSTNHPLSSPSVWTKEGLGAPSTSDIVDPNSAVAAANNRLPRSSNS